MDPLTDEQKEELNPPAPVPPMLSTGPEGTTLPDGKPGAEGLASSQKPPAKKPTTVPAAGQKKSKGLTVQKKKNVVTPIDRDRPSVTEAVAAIRATMLAHFGQQKKAALAAVGSVSKADGPFDVLSSDDQLKKLQKKLQEQIDKMAQDGAQAGLYQVAHLIMPSDDDVDEALDKMLSQANDKAVEYAKSRAAELVTQVDDTTRDRLRTLTARAEEEGWSNDQLADEIEAFSGFSADRAEMIARTETAFADVQGNLAGWQESGVVKGKRWLVGAGCCEDCEKLDGQVVALDEQFEPEDDAPIDGPPYHPNCRCDVAPGVMTDEELDEGDE
jgi:SPP1 gp7 family putative phage head morphogenesis protein